jgi:hypothetical protein
MSKRGLAEMSTKQVIGYEMQPGLGFSIYFNQGGNLAIKQTNGFDEEVFISLTKEEAWKLYAAIKVLADDCRPMVTEIYGEEDDGRIRDVLETVPAKDSESGSPQSVEPNAGCQA